MQQARAQERGTDSLIPRPVTGCNIRALPIGPLEAFVLSRVDGRASDQEIGLVTGLSTPEAAAILTRLALLGAVTYGTVTANTESSGKAPAAPLPGSATSGLHARAAASPPPPPPPIAAPVVAPPTDYDPAELDAAADLEPARKRLVLDTFYALERRTHYELLQVSGDADKKVIKAHYFDAVGIFHPDKYFGKNLGPFKTKIERIFQRLTEAHDILAKAKSREEYDRYLESQRATRALTGDQAQAEVDQIFAELDREARLGSAAERATPAPPANSNTARPLAGGPSGAARIDSSPSPDELRLRAPLTAEERRRALARKLGASIPPPRSASEPQMPAIGAREAAAENIRNRYETRLAQLRTDRIRRYVQQAEDAVASKNLVSAANALRVAVTLAPGDSALAARFDEVERLAAATLADQYLEQARYDERRGYFAEAAQAYERMLRGRPSPWVYERAAHCLVETRSDLKKAVDLAKKAVELAPREVAYRITLARAYGRAEKEQSALAELERARTLAPDDDTIKDWIKRVKRGEV
jgi:curved DNA-binding protein CbpA